MSWLPKQIIFSGDFFRSSDGAIAQQSNVIWLRDRLGDLLSAITGLPHAIRLPLAGNTVAEALALHDPALTPGLDNWAAIFWDRAADAMVDCVRQTCSDSLVITIEMPPILEDALNRAGVPWIDVGISPLRFLPDWAFHVKTSRHFDLGCVKGMRLTDADIRRYTAHVADWYGPAPLAEPVAVFFAQTMHDRTLIDGRHFCGVQEALAGVAELVECHRPFLIKPHPWMASSEVVSALVAAGGQVTDIATYRLLASPVVDVVTLSSSVGREALAFGRKCRILAPTVQDWAYAGMDVLQNAVSAPFWGTLLASAGLAVMSLPDVPAWRPDLLRGSIRQQGLDPAVWEGANEAVL